MVISLFNEVGKAFLHVFQGLLFPKIDFFAFQGFDKAFGYGLVVRVPFASQANLETMEQQGIHIIVSCLLHPLIRMMNHSAGWILVMNSHLQGLKAQGRIDMPGDGIAWSLFGKTGLE